MRSYALLSTTIEIASDLPEVSAWLDEFLRPAFEERHGSATDFSVRVRAGSEASAAVASTRPPGPLPETPCFALDQEVVCHPSWRVSERTVIEDQKLGAYYVLAGNQVEVVVLPGSSAFRTGAMRVIREIAACRALASPACLLLHAAAVEAGGRSVLVAGPKNAGKTTLLAYLAAATRTGILSNDRALVSRDASGFEVRGVPSIVSIRPQTLAFFPSLARGIPAVQRPAHLTLAEADAAFAAHGGVDARIRLRLSPPQLARQLGVPLSASARLSAVAFPATPCDRSSFRVDRLSVTEAALRLRESLFGVGSGKSATTAFERFTRARRPEHGDAAMIDAIASQVPCFSVGIGAERFAEPEAAEALLAACL